jgi:hypothetical protein
MFAIPPIKVMMVRLIYSPAMVVIVTTLGQLLVADGGWAQGCSRSDIEALIQTFEETNEVVLVATASCGAPAVDPLLAALDSDAPEWRRGNAAYVLGLIDYTNLPPEQQKAVQGLENALADDSAIIRHESARALGDIGLQDEQLQARLLTLLPQEPDPTVITGFLYALPRVGGDNPTVIGRLNDYLDHPEAFVKAEAALALKTSGTTDQDVVNSLTELIEDNPTSIIPGEAAADALAGIAEALLDDARWEIGWFNLWNLGKLREAHRIVSDMKSTLEGTAFQESEQRVDQVLARLNDELRWLIWILSGRNLILVHALFWGLLITVYPKSSQVQASFFWNPRIRKIMGLGYVGALLTWVPFLRSKLFSPFRESLLADAELDSFENQTYFMGSEVRHVTSGAVQPIQSAIPRIQGQIVLEGESGLGKSMFLRWLVKHSQRIVVFLRADRCTNGVMEAIQSKLQGDVPKDPNFLRNLIYSGTLDICIDGLNEVSAATRAKITGFMEHYFKGNIIITTQPIQWELPATAKAQLYRLQPLKPEQIEDFLVSRQSILPATATLVGADYITTCKDYLNAVLSPDFLEEERHIIQARLSNPLDLTLIAQMLAQGQQPNLLQLLQQQYDLMAEDYQQRYLRQFPLQAFSEAIYQMRLGDRYAIPRQSFPDEVQEMAGYKMVLSRNSLDTDGKALEEWYFRHDKIMDFFIAQTFVGAASNRCQEHLGDTRFRGVYLLLATCLPYSDAMNLREMLIQYAANSKDHGLSDEFIRQMRVRQGDS